MGFLLFIMQLIIATIAIVLVYKTLKYTQTIWRFKNRKKDGSKDRYFKRFD